MNRGHIETDLLDHRYEALEAWSESAETITMAAVGVEGRTAYPASPESRRPRHAAPPGGQPSRGPRTRIAILIAAGLALAAAAVAAMWGAADEPPAVRPVSSSLAFDPAPTGRA